MSSPATESLSVVVERELPFPPEKVWRALTQQPLIEEWLMKNDFRPLVGHAFTLRMDPQPNWNGVIDCEVLAVEPHRLLSYTWGSLGMKSVVTLTLTAKGSGTVLRMEQSGFRQDQQANYQGARFGWQKFLGNLERVLGGLA